MFTTEQFVPVTFYVYLGPYVLPEGTARFIWYGFIGVPAFVADGIDIVMGGYPEGSRIDAYAPVVESRVARSSPLIMGATWRISGSTATLSVAIEVEDRIRTKQNEVLFFVCQDGLIGQSNMVVAVLPPEPFLLTAAGETVTVERQFAIDPAWIPQDLRVVAAVQDRQTKEVLQAELADLEDVSAAPGDASPAAVVRLEARPNPFGPRTTIGFSLARPGQARLAVFDPAGRLVRTLVEDHLAAGEHHVTWHGDDDTGAPLASGTYFYWLELAGAGLSAGRVLLLR